MGTSGAYGGSAGFGPVRDPIADWIDGGGAGGGSPAGDGPADGDGQPAPPNGGPGRTPPAVQESLRELGRILSRGGSSGAGRAPGRPAVRNRSTGGAGGSARSTGGRSRARAASAGGSAVSAGYAARSGAAIPIPGIDLTAEEFADLSPWEQAARIVDAADPAGPREDGESPFHDDEIRQANSEFAIWLVKQSGPVTSDALVRRWLVAYIWTVWQREVGEKLRQMDDPADMRLREDEMRVSLEANLAGMDVPTTGVTPAAFREVIDRCLHSLELVFGEDEQ